MGISDLPIFGEDANQKNFIDDMNVDLLNVSNSDDSEHTAGGISHVSLRSINEVTTTVEMKCDNYATVQDGEEEEEMSTDGLLDDHGKHEIDRQARVVFLCILKCCGVYIQPPTTSITNSSSTM